MVCGDQVGDAGGSGFPPGLSVAPSLPPDPGSRLTPAGPGWPSTGHGKECLQEVLREVLLQFPLFIVVVVVIVQVIETAKLFC